jgi:hypothetical protein
VLASVLPKDSARSVLYYIFRAWRKHRQSGEVLWAKDYGLRAWRIPIRHYQGL